MHGVHKRNEDNTKSSWIGTDFVKIPLFYCKAFSKLPEKIHLHLLISLETLAAYFFNTECYSVTERIQLQQYNCANRIQRLIAISFNLQQHSSEKKYHVNVREKETTYLKIETLFFATFLNDD